MKLPLLAGTLLLAAAPAFAQQTSEQQLTIKLPLSSWNIIMNALQELPYKASSSVIGEIQSQAKAQIAPSPTDEKKK